MRLTPFVATVGLVGLLVGGLVTALVLNLILPGPIAFPTFRAGVFSTGSDPLHPYPGYPFTANNHPTKMIQIELTGPLDIKNLKPVITQMDVINAPPWTSGDPNTAQPYTAGPSWTPKTRMDLDLALANVGSNRDKILLKVVVDDPTVKFRPDNFAVAASDTNGRQMFFQIPNGYATKSVTFVAKYYYHPNSGPATLGSFNIGLIVADSVDPTNYYLPIFVDPEVKNNG